MHGQFCPGQMMLRGSRRCTSLPDLGLPSNSFDALTTAGSSASAKYCMPSCLVIL